MPADSPPVASTLEIGSVLDDRYRIDAVLGAGGMGWVYRAEHLAIGRVVAIKVLRTEIGQNAEASRRFQREALASGRLEHPNIVAVSDFGTRDDGTCYLVMELLEGESVATRIARGRVPWREGIDTLRGVLLGLKHAHERGVVHRDIKPDNIWLCVKGGERVVKLLDFGIAKLFAGSGGDAVVTSAGMTIGTPAYLSPEQALGGQITPASDLYSATAVLFEMLSGRPPFEETTAVATVKAHVHKRVPAIAEVAPGVVLPPGLEAIVQRGLEKTVRDRISSAAEYLSLLDGIAAHDEAAVVAAPVANVRSIADLAEPLPRKWLVAGGVTIAGAVVLAIAIALFGSSGRTAATTSPPLVPILRPPSEADREIMMKAALHDLQAGSNCEERRSAIPKLLDLDDERAIPALKRARYRMRGGILGIGDDNTNACLKADAEAAIKALAKQGPSTNDDE